MKAHVYLCGGINGLNDEEATSWRAHATERLSPHFDVLDPMARDYRGVEAQNVAAIVEGDLHDIGQCAFILVRAERPSWGTAMEVGFAHRDGRIVIAYGAGERPSPWLVHHTRGLYATLDEAISAIIELAQLGERRRGA